MPMYFQAPFDLIQTTTAVPNPVFDDTEALVNAVDMKRAMDGTVHTYVKRTNRSRLTYTFDLTRAKSLELIAFIKSYYTQRIRITNHKGEVWYAYIMTEPAELTSIRRGEHYSVTLQFDGEKQ